MFFRNLTLFRFPASSIENPEDLDTLLAEHTLKPVGPLELASRGFVSPLGQGEDALTHQVADAVLLTLATEQRLLPGSVVNAKLSEKLEHIRESEGRNPGGRERKRIKDEVIAELLPRAFARPSRCSGYLDLGLGWCVIDTSSRKHAETFVTAIREAMGSFPAVPASTETSPRALMTAWIDGEPLPAGFMLGDECELRDPVDSGAVLKCKNQELQAEEIREHLKCGKQGFRVALVFEDRISFVLGEDLVIRKLKFLDAATAPLEDTIRDTQRDEVDAVFALMSGELRVLLQRLDVVLGFATADL